MKRVLKYGIAFIITCLLLLGCKGNHHEIPTTHSGQKFYHEIGDTFQFNGPESGLPFEITVKKIWMEDFEKHEAYISEHVYKPDDRRAVMFISYRVKNIGDLPYEFKDDRFYPNNDVLPNLINPNNMIFDVDITYPKNRLIDDMEKVTELTLKPGESMDITGAVITYTEAKYDGAFVWDYDADIPQVVFTRSQSERKDQVGVYEIGDPIYVMDIDGVQFNVTFNDIYDVKSNEDMEDVKRVYASSPFLVLDMTIENDGEKDILIPWAIPEFNTNGHHIFQQLSFIKKGETMPIKDMHINPQDEPTDGLVKPGETVEGTLYLEVENMRTHEVMTLDAQVYYPYEGFTEYYYYKQWINYNLD